MVDEEIRVTDAAIGSKRASPNKECGQKELCYNVIDLEKKLHYRFFENYLYVRVVLIEVLETNSTT